MFVKVISALRLRIEQYTSSLSHLEVVCALCCHSRCLSRFLVVYVDYLSYSRGSCAFVYVCERDKDIESRKNKLINNNN